MSDPVEDDYMRRIAGIARATNRLLVHEARGKNPRADAFLDMLGEGIVAAFSTDPDLKAAFDRWMALPSHHERSRRRSAERQARYFVQQPRRRLDHLQKRLDDILSD